MKKYTDLNKKINTKIDSMADHSKLLESHMDTFIKDSKSFTEADMDEVISDIDREFCKQTSIHHTKDQLFLWTAVALQTTRWILLPAFKTDEVTEIIEDKSERIKADEGKAQEENDKKDYLDKNDTGNTTDDANNENENTDDNSDNKESEYLDKKEYFKRPVPYDVMNGDAAKDLVIDGVTPEGKNIAPSKHHSATLGHDPVLGYVFGTFNIMTFTVTFHRKDLPSNIVNLLGKNKTEVGEQEPFGSIIKNVVNAEIEDSYRIPWAVVRQTMHMASDKYTKEGLPIPFLTAKKQQEFLDKGWNSEEVKRIVKSLNKYWGENIGILTAQFIISFILNIIIRQVFFQLYDEKTDGDFDLYKVRASKVLKVSNEIASVLNLAYVGFNVGHGLYTTNAVEIKQGLSKMDLGGYIETVHQIVSNRKLQEQMRREYLEQHLYEKFIDNTYSFLEDDNNE